MNFFFDKNIALLAIVLVFFVCQRSAYGQERITVGVETLKPGQSVSHWAIGLSYETRDLLPKENGEHYFNPENKALIKMFKTIGVKSLRIGGNSVDAPGIPIPAENDIHSFFKFAKAAGVKVIYSVRLQNGDPAKAKEAAKIIRGNYKDILESFAIGNEPSYYKDYDIYVSKWTAIRDAILEVYPDAVFSGPDQNPDAKRLKLLVNQFGNEKERLVQITQHSYPLGCSYSNYKEHDVTKLVPFDAVKSRAKMLNDSVHSIYEGILNGMTEAVKGTSLTFRLSETNSFWYSGLKGASDSYGSALWGLDYLHWWMSHGAAGLNFHTGDFTGGEIVLPCRYAAFVSSGSGYEARPLAYGMKMFSLGACSRYLPVKVASSGNNISAYAGLDENNVVVITLINKEFKSGKPNVIDIQLYQPLRKSKVETILLKALTGDIGVGSSDVTIGDSPIGNDARWKGQWTKLSGKHINGNKIQITLPSASALVLRVSIN